MPMGPAVLMKPTVLMKPAVPMGAAVLMEPAVSMGPAARMEEFPMSAGPCVVYAWATSQHDRHQASDRKLVVHVGFD
jgi:hypothetical protein